jgi:uncharacterized protein
VSFHLPPFGLSESDWRIFERIVLIPLKTLGAEVWVFGSRARGQHRPFSDLDVLYRLNEATKKTDANFDARIFEIKANAEDSNLAIKVDLVDESTLAASYRDAILEDRIAI